jgi:hypothetical protein
MHAKAYILEGYGASSTLELTEKQLDDIILRIEKIIKQQKEEKDSELRYWRHKCIRMIAECGINTQDWNDVNAFILNRRIAGRHLYELDINELKELHRKLHNVRDNMLRKQNELKQIAIMN